MQFNNLAFRLFLCILPLFLAMLIQPAHAQEARDTTTLYIIQTTDGNEYIGQIVDENETFILLKTARLGEITINKQDIRSIKAVDEAKVVEGEYWYRNLQSSRYFFSPNGYGLKKGEGYYQNVWVVYNQASIGITDNISIGAGTIPLFLLAAPFSPVWIVPKLSVPIVENKFNLGAGALLGTVVGEEGTSFGIVYGLGTVGSPDRNASLGVGFGFAGSDFLSTPVISFSALYRITKNGYLLTENYFMNINDYSVGLIMLGGRSMIRRVGLDYGLVIPAAAGLDGVFTLPWLGLTVPFTLNKAQQ